MDSNYYKKLLIHNNVDINENINDGVLNSLGMGNTYYKEISIKATYKEKVFICRKNFDLKQAKYPLECLNIYINGMYKDIVRLIKEHYSLNYDFEQ